MCGFWKLNLVWWSSTN